VPDSSDNGDARKAVKPNKPYPDYPLYAHASGRWAKKIRGRTHYFGPWRDWRSALERYKFEIDYLIRGKVPPDPDATLTVADLVNFFLQHRQEKVDSGEMAQRSWNDYRRTGEKIVASLGRHTPVESLDATDFQSLRSDLSKGLGLVALGNEIGRSRVVFNYAYKNDLIDKPIKMGISFDKPSKKSLRKEKATKPKRIFEHFELRKLLREASPQMRCFILLALNGGLGNSDIGQLEPRHIVEGWIDYPRPKTLVERRFPLWPETLEALEESRSEKSATFVFVTKYGQPWYRDSKASPLSAEFRKLCEQCGVHQPGRGFYSLRHQFRTVADSSRDKVAIDRIMGHLDPSMGDVYREWIEPERLQLVVDHVREWLKPIWWKV
jgi:integrase